MAKESSFIKTEEFTMVGGRGTKCKEKELFTIRVEKLLIMVSG